MKVLVVEDNPVVAMDYELVLEEFGHQVMGPVATVGGALLLIEDDEPDAAILDFQLKLGTSVLLMIRFASSQTPFVVVTGSPSELEGSDFSDLVIEKPCEPETVIRKLLAQAEP